MNYRIVFESVWQLPIVSYANSFEEAQKIREEGRDLQYSVKIEPLDEDYCTRNQKKIQ